MKEQGRKKTIAAALTMLLAALTFSLGFSSMCPPPPMAHAESAKTTLTAQLDLTSAESADKLATEGYAWNKDSKTMTMDGFTLDTADRQALLLPADAVIVLQAGSVNSVKSGDTTALSQEDNYVVHCAGNLTVQGSGKLNLQTGNSQFGYCDLYALAADNLTLCESVEINIVFGNFDAGKLSFMGAGCLSFTMRGNAKLNVSSGVVPGDPHEGGTYAIFSENDVLFMDNAIFTCNLLDPVENHAISAEKDITVSGSADLDLTCNDTGFAVLCGRNFAATGGRMQVTVNIVLNGTRLSSSYALLVGGSSTFIAGEVVLTCNTPDAVPFYAVASKDGFLNEDALVYAKSADGYTGLATAIVFTLPEMGNFYSYFASGKPITDLKITGFVHTVSPDWASDETGHWYAADCGKSEHNEGFAAHTFAKGVCTVCAYSVATASLWWLWLVIGVAAALVLYLVGFLLYKKQILKGKLADVLYGWLNKLFTRKKPE